MKEKVPDNVPMKHSHGPPFYHRNSSRYKDKKKSKGIGRFVMRYCLSQRETTKLFTVFMRDVAVQGTEQPSDYP
ncbi:hypothetical protein KTT_24470 [Tengunoibacter tsumagoiensis]|uniref:Uncharacterized protein n=1 Tax=Tengunoibacter tsumagoiensis TaxID=2014871 RepID=A0A402A0B1_9CHLR|nr:hypothetical protein KTT_24470 [Tengunoibacter tsumagoiensis]